MSGRLSGKVAVVTGGARQIGFAIASRYAAEGAKVVLAQRSAEEGAAAAEQITQQGGEVISIITDVSVESSVEAMVDQAMSRYGAVHIMVNNAGVGIAERITELDYSEYERVIGINVGGVLLCTKYAARAMQSGGHGGSIIIISLSM